MEIKFDNVSISIPYEEYFKKIMANPFELMFSKPNMEQLNNFFMKLPSGYANFMNEFGKQMEKYANANGRKESNDKDK
jgi:hypothetical protein